MAQEIKKEIKTELMTLNLGPQHPSTHGVLRLVLTLDGERIVKAEPHLGYLHRGVEKLCENLQLSRIIPLFDRLDYVANINNELSLVMAVEKLMDIRVPERAEYIRVIMAEFNRILSHLIWLGAFIQDIGLLGTVFLYGFREREKIQRMMEAVTGARMHYHYFRYGGVAQDLTEEFPEEALKYLDNFDSVLDEFEEMIEDNEIFLVRTKGIGALSAEDAINFGVSGPMLRASEVKIDLRKLEPYSVYPHFDFDVPVEENGDCFDRYKVRMVEMRQSARIIRQALQSLPGGLVRTPVPRRIKPPEGEVYMRTEHAKGEFGVYLISDGSHRPYRLKIRSPSFVNLMVAPKILEGMLIPDLIATLGSIDIVMGCIDR